MSFEIRVDADDSWFCVLRPKSALAALKGANRARPLRPSSDDEEDVSEEIEHARTLADALAVCGWDVERDDAGRIEQLFYAGNIVGDFDDLERLFATLAPFVHKRSWVRINGEDELTWLYTFKAGRLRVDAD